MHQSKDQESNFYEGIYDYLLSKSNIPHCLTEKKPRMVLKCGTYLVQDLSVSLK